MQANIRVSGDPVLAGLKSEKFERFDERRSIGGTERAAILPQVPNPKGTPAKKGTHQQSAGVVVQPDVKSREIEIVAYNTSAPDKGLERLACREAGNCLS